MNTSFRVIGRLYEKIGIKRLKTPKFMQNRVFRIIILALFVASMLITRKMGIKVDIILYITVFSILLTLIFEESSMAQAGLSLWHHIKLDF